MVELSDSERTGAGMPARERPIRVVVADDSEITRGVIFDILDADREIEVAGMASSADEAIELLRSEAPEVALVDVRMPGGGGSAVLEAIAGSAGGPRVIAMSAAGGRDAVMEMLASGAVGYLTKGGDVEEMISAVKRAAAGESVLSPSLSRQLIGAYARSRREHVDRRHEERQVRRRVLETIAGEDLAIAFQPIRELAGMGAVGYEALARFNHGSERGPVEWFAEASAAGLSVELETMAARKALESFGAVGRAGGRHAFLSVNASPATVCDPRFVKMLDGSGDQQVVVEVTEHAGIHDYPRFGRAVERLRRRGVRLAVDDAGAGYASLRHILNIDPDLIKLDIALTRDIDTDPARRAMGRALVSFATEREAMVVAEGIETEAELETLRELRVPAGQGFHLGRPAIDEVAA